MSATERQTIAYARPGGRTLSLHVERPARCAEALPALLDVHGGAWTHFDPRVDFYWRRELALRGFVVASAELRMAPSHPWPAPYEDLRAAARWLRANAAALGVDAGAIGVLGGSSGGHLATCLALWPGGMGAAPTPALDVADDADAAVACAIALWPILDVPARYAMVRDARFDPLTTRLAARLRGDAPLVPRSGGEIAARLERLDRLRRTRPSRGERIATLVQRGNAWQGRIPLARALLYAELRAAHEAAFADVATMEAASPLQRLRAHGAERVVPMLVVQGLADPNVTPAMTQAFASAYRAKGGAIDLRFEPGLGHSYGNVPSRAADRLIDAIDAFARAALARA